MIRSNPETSSSTTAVLPAGDGALTIPILSTVGHGPTTLAAFDDALLRVGVANFNLVRLSSVIPPRSTVFETDTAIALPGSWGDRLYCVYARQDAVEHGAEAWAGIAWVQDPETGKGLFVEHEGLSEHKVQADLESSIATLCENRGLDLEPHMHVVGGACEESPISALVIAPYAAESWDRASFS